MGVIDDQPLWLVSWASTQATPSLASAIDLRLIGRGPANFVATSDRVREYFAEAGATLRIGGQDWQCNLGPGDTLTWVPVGAGSSSGSTANGTWRISVDGTQTCHYQMSFPAKPGKSQTQKWTFPKGFTSAPMMLGSIRSTAPENCDLGFSSISTTSVNVEFKRATDAGTNVLLEAKTW